VTEARDRSAALLAALHPLDTPPAGPGWNHSELIDLLPDCGRSLHPAAVLIGLIDRGEGCQVLLTRRNESLRHHAGQISFPGGRIETADADPVAAALREAREEIGLQGEDVKALGYLDPFVTITGFHVYPVVAHVAAQFSAVRDPSEVEEVFEVPFDFLMDPENARLLEVDYRGGKRKLVEFRYLDYRVWGATAAMLVNLRERLERSR
jgi:8-oxo-dGTP pyrophosphatase MutT (NUDIX family)